MTTVLLVDDDNIVLLALGARLQKIGYTVCAATDAATAISVARRNSPDVIVLDISLPGGNGFLVAERLKNIAGPASTPLIFITASEDVALRERAMKAGAKAFLKKPFDVTTLADAIESALSPGDNWPEREDSRMDLSQRPSEKSTPRTASARGTAPTRHRLVGGDPLG